MEIKTKKFLAREFLIFLVLVGIALLTIGLISCSDFYFYKKLSALDYELYSQKRLVDSTYKTTQFQNSVSYNFEGAHKEGFSQEGIISYFISSTEDDSTTLKIEDSLVFEKFKTDYLKMKTIEHERSDVSGFKIGYTDRNEIGLVVFCLGLIVLYAIRPLVFAIKWSIKTIKM